MILQAVGRSLETSGQRMVFLSRVVMAGGCGIDMGAGYKDCRCGHTSCSSDSGRGGGQCPPVSPSSHF